LYKLIINSYRELTGLNNHKHINRLSIVYNEELLLLNENEKRFLEGI
jgi:hypothetical protein